MAAAAVQTIINSATSSAGTATGFNFQDVLAWMSANVLQPIAGTGLGVLQGLLPYILGLIALAALIYFAFRAFRFFHH